ncbi:AEC family transporter [Lactobacillus sp. ESL0701]|uniref:AEC family transporter n=1 Tax=Lactobacillus sp. ESL0701 TaxID=2983217 RepID=UPI0023F8B5D6|nr:AEC family transporter [Lactobacillus sp. ESL0701]MDF7672952.1 AEC family transporter [Lactobacillus sp. ESL0701]
MQVFLTSVSSVVVIILIMALGFLLKQYNWIGDSFSKEISEIITKIALPASIFTSVMEHLNRGSLFQLVKESLFPVLGILIGYIIAAVIVKVLKIKPGRRGIFMAASVNANTVFIGMPLNLALFGEKAMSYLLIYYIVNTFSTWTFGAFFIQNDDPTAKSKKVKLSLKKILPPALIGFIVAIVWMILGIPVPTFAGQTLSYVGNLVTPLSLIYIGIILHDAGLKNIRLDRDTVMALVGRFIISPLVLIILIKIGMGAGYHMPDLMRQTLVVQSATPMPAVLPILANEAHGDVKFATNAVALSSVLFVIVVPILMTILKFI